MHLTAQACTQLDTQVQRMQPQKQARLLMRSQRAPALTTAMQRIQQLLLLSHNSLAEPLPPPHFVFFTTTGGGVAVASCTGSTFTPATGFRLGAAFLPCQHAHADWSLVQCTAACACSVLLSCMHAFDRRLGGCIDNTAIGCNYMPEWSKRGALLVNGGKCAAAGTRHGKS